MDDAAEKENPPADLDAASRPAPKDQDAPAPGGEAPGAFNKIDLTQLQGFSFGTQWTQDKSGASGKGGDRGDRGDRPRREAFQGEAPNRKDRRSFQRPMGAPGGGEGYRPSGPSGQGGGGPREGSGDFRGGARPADRRQAPGPGGGDFNRRRPMERESAPYVSPYFSATFYPEDTSFGALVKTIRASSRTIELFEIARTVLAKAERFTVLVGRKSPDGEYSARRGPEAAPAPAPVPAAAPAAPKPVLYISVPDNLPFETEEAAVAHVLKNHLALFFDQAGRRKSSRPRAISKSSTAAASPANCSGPRTTTATPRRCSSISTRRSRACRSRPTAPASSRSGTRRSSPSGWRR